MAYPLRMFTQRIRALVLKRSIDLVENRRVELLDHDDEHAQFHVENQKDGYYHVEVRLRDKLVTFTHCDCPYRGVGLCKHTGAALLQLMVNDGFDLSEFSELDFKYDDSEVIDIEAMEENVRKIIKEISLDNEFELVEFLSNQDKDKLLTFILKYLEESEDIRLVIMAYMWYKSQNPKPPFLS